VHTILATNLVGTIIVAREAVKLMRRHSSRRRIVNFSSVAVPLNIEGEAIYAASKSAVESFTKIFAREVAEFSITVNTIGPTPIKTDLLKNIPQSKLDLLIQRQAIKRWGEMRDISHTIDFLIDKNSDFITGQTIYLGGVN
jgi:3-oxoacyl-[acyl-carrier protein] reductase